MTPSVRVPSPIPGTPTPPALVIMPPPPDPRFTSPIHVYCAPVFAISVGTSVLPSTCARDTSWPAAPKALSSVATDEMFGNMPTTVATRMTPCTNGSLVKLERRVAFGPHRVPPFRGGWAASRRQLPREMEALTPLGRPERGAFDLRSLAGDAGLVIGGALAANLLNYAFH